MDVATPCRVPCTGLETRDGRSTFRGATKKSCEMLIPTLSTRTSAAKVIESLDLPAGPARGRQNARHTHMRHAQVHSLS